MKVWVLLNINNAEVNVGGVFAGKVMAQDKANDWIGYKDIAPIYMWQEWEMDCRSLVHRETGRFAGRTQLLMQETVIALPQL